MKRLWKGSERILTAFWMFLCVVTSTDQTKWVWMNPWTSSRNSIGRSYSREAPRWSCSIGCSCSWRKAKPLETSSNIFQPQSRLWITDPNQPNMSRPLRCFISLSTPALALASSSAAPPVAFDWIPGTRAPRAPRVHMRSAGSRTWTSWASPAASLGGG